MSPRLFIIGLLLLEMLIFCGCRRDMFNQPKANPLRENDFFTDTAGSRPIPSGTVAHEDKYREVSFDTGANGTNFLTTFPMPITKQLLLRGQQRFEIDCVPCHGLGGDGDGIVVQRGFPAPTSFHSARLRAAPVGHFVNVMAKGYGLMFPHSTQVAPADRWAIAAYIRALQFSRHVTLADLPASDAAKIDSPP